jgi:hypothetical protein
MNFDDQLTVAMRSTADAVAPPVADLVAGGMQRGRDIRRRQTVRRSVLAGAVVLAAGAVSAAVMVAVGGRGAPAITPGVPTPTASLPAAITFDPRTVVEPAQTVALAIDHKVQAGGALDRHDPTALAGPWTVVLRSNNGSLGHNGAVVTFPVSAPTTGQPTPVGSVSGSASPGMVIWPIASQYARIRGDLTAAELAAIAADTSIVSGRPAVHPPGGYAVVSSGTYRSPDIRESRYGSTGLGVAAALGDGLTYTGVTTGGGFEDQLYATAGTTDTTVTTVNGKPAIVSTVLGGNATLAWEPAPGIIAYVGYSGALLDDKAITALRALAGRTQPLSLAQWQTTDPQTNDQPNTLG